MRSCEHINDIMIMESYTKRLVKHKYVQTQSWNESSTFIRPRQNGRSLTWIFLGSTKFSTFILLIILQCLVTGVHGQTVYDPSKPQCNAKIIVDDKFYSKYGDGNETTTTEVVTSLIDKVNKLFIDSPFTSISTPQLFMSELVIYKTGEEESNLVGNNVSNDGIISSVYSTPNSSKYCLVIYLVYRSVYWTTWNQGVSYNNSAHYSGICGRYIAYPHAAPNVVMANFSPDNVSVPIVNGDIVLAYSITRAFGAGENDSLCHSLVKTDFHLSQAISYWRQSIDWAAARQLSSCDINSVSSIVLRQGGNCFQPRDGSLCGNGRVDAGEKCDCGSNDAQMCAAIDPCCNPGTCTLTETAVCSPLASSCCTQQCQVASSGVICMSGSDCMQSALCDGVSSTCPYPTFASESTLCNNRTNTCLAGSCQGSVCSLHNLVSCTCSETDQCHLCCRNTSGNCSSLESFIGGNSSVISSLYKDNSSSCSQNGAAGTCNGQGVCAHLNVVSGSTNSSSDSNNNTTWIVLGICLGVLLILLLISVYLWIYRRDDVMEWYLTQKYRWDDYKTRRRQEKECDENVTGITVERKRTYRERDNSVVENGDKDDCTQNPMGNIRTEYTCDGIQCQGIREHESCVVGMESDSEKANVSEAHSKKIVDPEEAPHSRTDTMGSSCDFESKCSETYTNSKGHTAPALPPPRNANSNGEESTPRNRRRNSQGIPYPEVPPRRRNSKGIAYPPVPRRPDEFVK